MFKKKITFRQNVTSCLVNTWFNWLEKLTLVLIIGLDKDKFFRSLIKITYLPDQMIVNINQSINQLCLFYYC